MFLAAPGRRDDAGFTAFALFLAFFPEIQIELHPTICTRRNLLPMKQTHGFPFVLPINLTISGTRLNPSHDGRKW
jgi:hypothetical protein